MPGGIHPPIEVIASWPPGNYVDPTTRPKALTILACIFGPLTTFFMMARLWVRIHIQRSAGLDDWLMVAAAVPVLAITVLIPLSADKYHFNRHVWDVEPPYWIIQRKYVMAVETIYCVAAGLIKISILLFYRRLSSRAVSNTFRWATWITIACIGAYSIAFALIPIFGCNPISAFWDQLDIVKIAEGYEYKCFNEGADVFAAGVISASQDLLTALLPTFLYWNLHVPIRQKVALFGIFAIGYGVVALGAVRTYYSWVIFFETYDVTWYVWDAFLWSLLEIHIGAMCANAPALKVFFKHFLQLEKHSTRSKSNSNGSKGKSPFSSFTSASGLGKMAFWKLGQPQLKHGYFSEPHTEVSIDQHGGVRIQKDVHVVHSPLRAYHSTDIIFRNYDDDIEMGSIISTGARSPTSKSASQADMHDVQALPRLSQSQPQGPASATPRPPPPTAIRGSSPLPLKVKPPAWQTWS